MSKKITVGQLRNLLNQLDSEEISFSKMAEILNETSRDIRIENDNLNFVIKELNEQIKRLKVENQSYFQIQEMADNDYTMMQAIDFAEWLQKKSYEPTDKTYKVDLNDWRPIQSMYDLFIKEQFSKKDVS